MTRFTAEHRRAQIVQTARNFSYDGGLYDWTLKDIAAAIRLSRPAIAYYFNSTVGLRNEVILEAIKSQDVPILVQALARYDPVVDNLKPFLRDKCAEFIGR